MKVTHKKDGKHCEFCGNIYGTGDPVPDKHCSDRCRIYDSIFKNLLKLPNEEVIVLIKLLSETVELTDAIKNFRKQINGVSR